VTVEPLVKLGAARLDALRAEVFWWGRRGGTAALTVGPVPVGAHARKSQYPFGCCFERLRGENIRA